MRGIVRKDPLGLIRTDLKDPYTTLNDSLVVMLNNTDWRVQLAAETGHVESNIWTE